MKALATTGDGKFTLQDVPVPSPGSNQVLVRVVAVAQNPTDWKMLLLHKTPGYILGCDYAGTVVEIGPGVSADTRRIGERVAGFVHGGISPHGTYAEYVVAPADVIISVPDSLSFEDAAQLGIACYTACQCLYQTLKLPLPTAPATSPQDVLIWSGTSSTGQFAIQLAKLSGLRVITTASPKNFDFVKSLGADDVFDYASSHTARKIQALTNGTLRHAVDCIGEGMTPNQVSVSLSATEGGTIATLLPYKSRTKGVTTEFVLSYSIFGKDITMPFSFPKNLGHVRNAVEYSKLLSALLRDGKLKMGPVKLYPHGLQSVAEGFDYMREGKVHAEKIVYRIADTPGL